jgi:hypothetical protein
MHVEQETKEDRHPFTKRGARIKRVLFALTKDGPTSWEAIFAGGRSVGVMDATMRRAVNEGVDLGVFIKSGGRSGYKYGMPSGPPMVHLTDGGRVWVERMFPEVLDEVEAGE